MTIQLTPQQINLAVNWWANVIQHPKFDAGADNPGLVIAEILALQNVQEISEEDLHIFRLRLANLLSQPLTNDTLSVDYTPCLLLVAATQGTKIPTSNFPWKTCMWFGQESTVSVSYGYRADTVTFVEDGDLTQEQSLVTILQKEGLIIEDAEQDVILETPGHFDLPSYQLEIVRQLKEQGQQRIYITPNVILEGELVDNTKEVILPPFQDQDLARPEELQASQDQDAQSDNPAIPKVEEQPYQLTPSQESEQTELWTFVISNEAKRIAKRQPISALRTSLKKLRRDTSSSKLFTRKVLKIVIKRPDAWLTSWVSDITQAVTNNLKSKAMEEINVETANE